MLEYYSLIKRNKLSIHALKQHEGNSKQLHYMKEARQKECTSYIIYSKRKQISDYLRMGRDGEAWEGEITKENTET